MAPSSSNTRRVFDDGFDTIQGSTWSPETIMSNTAGDLESLHELNKRFIHNFVTNDVESHDAILHPEFRNVTSTGGHVARPAYLKRWATGFDPDVIVYWTPTPTSVPAGAGFALSPSSRRSRRRITRQTTPSWSNTSGVKFSRSRAGCGQ